MCMYYGYGKVSNSIEEEAKKWLKEERESAKRALRCVRYQVADQPHAPFTEWVNEQFDRIAYYEKVQKDKKRFYVVSCECGNTFDIPKAKTGTYIQCPHCNKRVRLRNTAVSTHYGVFKGFAFVEKVSDGWVQRIFVAYKNSFFKKSNCLDVRMEISEEQRDFIGFDGFQGGKYWSFHKKRWSEEYVKGAGYLHGSGYYAWRAEDLRMQTYPFNLNREFYGSKFQYAQLEKAAEISHVNPFCYLRKFEQFPQLEFFYKAGLYRLAEELMFENFDRKVEMIKKIRNFKDIGVNTPMDLEECAQENYGIEELRARMKVIKWDVPRGDLFGKAIDFMVMVHKNSGEDFAYSFISMERLFKYWLEQVRSGIYKEEQINYFWRDYTDYIAECIELQMNLNDSAIRTPHDLKTMHKEMGMRLKIEENRVLDAGIFAMYSAYHKMCEWADEKMCVIMPQNAAEIIEEGTRQSHCVARYCTRVAQGECIILFVRRAAAVGENFYTMQIAPDMKKLNIVQCRGYGNEDPSKEVRAEVDAFLKRYEKWFNHRKVTKNDHVTALYYKAVRKKDGKYISNWDSRTEFRVGEVSECKMNKDPDRVAVEGLHVASFEFARNYGAGWKNVAILECEVNLNDVIVPDAVDQIRARRIKVLREVPKTEWDLLSERAAG